MNLGGAAAGRVVRVALAVGALIATASAVVPGPASAWLVALCQNGVVIGLLAAAVGRLRREGGAKWWCIVIYAAGFVVAQAGWSLFGYASGPTALHLWPDWLYGAAMPIGLIGLVWLAFDGLERSQTQRVLSDAAAVASALGLAGWVVCFELTGLDARVAQSPATMLFPALDLVAAAIIITAAIYQPHRPRLAWMAAAIPMATVSDVLIVVLRDPANPSPLAAALMGVSWFAVPAFMLTAALTGDRDRHAFPLTQGRRQSVTVFVLVGVCGAVVQAFHHGMLFGPALWLGIAMATATIVNQFAVFRELHRSVEAHRDALEALGASEEEFRLTFEGAPIGIMVFEEGVLRAANPTAYSMIGLDDLAGVSVRDVVGYDEVPEFLHDEWTRESDAIETLHRDVEWTRPDGERIWMHLSLARDPGAGDDRVIATIEDITERTAVTDRLAHLAVHDSLTGLPNRVAFMASLDEALAGADQSVAVAFLDLDRFKVINDSVGHVSGDRVLAAVTERLLGVVGERGTVARLAGDEFTILLVDRDRSEVISLIEQVQQALGEPLVLAEGIETYPTASVGVAFAAPGERSDDLVARADAAMYRAKERGRNTYELYDESVELGAHAELRLVGELHRALERSEFRVFYQPVVDATTETTVGYEALLRWQHPQRGLLAPADFLEAAEASGLIVPIGSWVLEEALGQLVTWQQTRPDEQLTMAVNLAARQVRDELPDTVATILAATGVDPDLVWLELTESALMFDSRNAEAVLARLRDQGVHISVDDFGTGYSSLTYLQRLPIEGIKLDRSFVDGLGTRDRDEAICHAVTSLGSALGLRTVAEGVETRLQAERLAAMGCAHLQGYLFGRPQPATAITAAATTRDVRDPAGSASSTTGPTTATAIR